MQTFTAVIEYDEETGRYVGIIPDVPGGHADGLTLDELQQNLRGVLETLIAENAIPQDRPKFVGVQQIEIAE